MPALPPAVRDPDLAPVVDPLEALDAAPPLDDPPPLPARSELPEPLDIEEDEPPAPDMSMFVSLYMAVEPPPDELSRSRQPVTVIVWVPLP